MLGVFTTSNDDKFFVNKKQIRFVSIPDDLSNEEIKERFSQLARDFANAVDTNNVYLIFGKETISYEYEI